MSKAERDVTCVFPVSARYVLIPTVICIWLFFMYQILLAPGRTANNTFRSSDSHVSAE